MKYQPPYGVSDPDAPYQNGDPSIAKQGSILPAAAAEFPQREIVHVIEKNNIAPNDNDLFQLTRATRAQWVNFCVDTGSQNAMSVALDPPLTMYRQGLPLRVLVKNNNSGPTTINVNGLGNRAVTRANGAQLEANDLRVGMIALLVDDGSKFQMVNFQGVLATANNNYYIDIPYAQDTGTPGNCLGIYSPPITTAVNGDLVLLRVAYRNPGPVMFTVNSMAPKPIVRNDGKPLQAYDLEENEIIILVYNVNAWQALRLMRSQVMFKLTANLILYVRTDGNDTTGDGSTNDAAHAFKTVQRAVDFVKASFVTAGRTVTIQLGMPGTYVGKVYVSNLPGSIVIRGDPANVPSYVMQGPSDASCLDCVGSGIDVTLQGITFVLQSANNYYLTGNYGSYMTIDNCSFTGVQTAWGPLGLTAATATWVNNIHFYQHVGTCMAAVENSAIISGAWYTAFYVHGIAFSSAFAWANGGSQISLYYGYVNLIGTGYGYRYFSTLNSVILTGAGGAEWLPGNVNGIVDASSVYT